MSILILLFLISLALIALAHHRCGLREAGVIAYVGLFTTIVISTEWLSLQNAVTFGALAALWALWVGCATALAWRSVNRSYLLTVIHTCRAQARTLEMSARLSLMMTLSILGLTLIVALSAPPNTWDSMTYHMARVAAWIQHGNVDFYPTSITRQNYQSPLSGFAILHLQLLSGSDRLANLAQWSSFLLCIVMVSLVIKELRQPLTAQCFGALLTATLPAAILQATSTQTDLVCGAMCLAFAFLLIRFTREQTPSYAIYCGLALGLALLSKGTAYLFIAAIGVSLGTLCLVRLRGLPWPNAARAFGLAALLAVLLNTGHWSRTYALYGQPLSGGTESYANDAFSVTATWANLVRNAGLHLGIPVPAVNRTLTQAITALLGSAASDPKTTWPRTRFFVTYSTHEDKAGNILHVLLIAGALAGLCKVKIGDRALILAWAGTVIAGAVLFSACLKWQPWHGRLHIPLFVLGIPVVAAVWSAAWREKTGFLTVLACLLCITGAPFLLNSATRPLLPQPGFSLLGADRLDAIRRIRPDVMGAYSEAMRVALATNANELGLMLGDDDWEYPLWLLAGKSAVRRQPLFRHVAVENSTRTLDPDSKLPDVILCTRRLTGATIMAHGYTIAYESGTIRVLIRQPQPPRS
jgi:hypothetical protein